jgi:hypothetical protein
MGLRGLLSVWPRTLLCVGTTCARVTTDALAIWLGFILTAVAATGCEFANAFEETAVTAPGALRFT